MSQPALPIPPSWLERSVLAVAPDLIGCTIVRQFEDGRQLRGRIVETEAYQEDDPGCHGYRGKTARNAAIFGPAGLSYVYLIYGMYHCFNVVTDRDGFGSAVLVRAVELDGEPRRAYKGNLEKVGAGPGKLCQAMEIDRQHNHQWLQRGAAIWLEPRSPDWQGELVRSTRIGLSQGQDLPWRWYLRGSKGVSRL
jgi:DNA-3-methyladenine glycosylase